MMNDVVIDLKRLHGQYWDCVGKLKNPTVNKIIISFENMNDIKNIELHLSWLTTILKQARNNNINTVEFKFLSFSSDYTAVSNVLMEFLKKNSQLQNAVLNSQHLFLRFYFNLLVNKVDKNMNDIITDFAENISQKMAFVFICDFLKNQFPQFQVNNSYFSQAKTLFNFFTCQEDAICEISKLLDKLGKNQYVNYLEINELLKDVIEDYDDKFELEEFKLLSRCSEVFEKIIDAYKTSPVSNSENFLEFKSR